MDGTAFVGLGHFSVLVLGVLSQRSHDGICGFCFVWTLHGVLVLSGHGLHKSRFTACLFFVFSAADRHRESETEMEMGREHSAQRQHPTHTQRPGRDRASTVRQDRLNKSRSTPILASPPPHAVTVTPAHNPIQSNPTTRDGRIGSARILASGPRKLGLDTKRNSLTWRPYEVSKRRAKLLEGT